MKFLGLLLILRWARSEFVDFADYESARQKIMISEEQMAFGGQLTLEQDEKLANQCLMTAKFQEVDEGLFNFCNYLGQLFL